jgi:hypothetical protein
MKHVGRFLLENERLLVVAASTMIMSLSHTALRPVLPVFAKASPAPPCTVLAHCLALPPGQHVSLSVRGSSNHHHVNVHAMLYVAILKTWDEIKEL